MTLRETLRRLNTPASPDRMTGTEVAFALCVFFAIFAVVMLLALPGALHGLGHWLGISDEAGAGYAFWSGFGSDLGILAAVVVYANHHTCHTRGCFRFGRHAVEGTPYVVCRHHHPDVPDRGASTEHIHAAHAAAKKAPAAAKRSR